jgi:putative oxidoreductase
MHPTQTLSTTRTATAAAAAPPAHPGQTRSALRLFRRLLATTSDPAPALARVALGLVMFPHGAQHALGWFGGYGFSGTYGWMTGTLGIPGPLAALALVTELLAPIFLVLGLGGRIAAAGIFGLMAVAASTHAGSGFFMNWFGKLAAGAEGFEYHLLALALAAVVALAGSGAWSLDRRWQTGSVHLPE